MANDLFRRLVLFSPEIIEESAQTGGVSPETMQVVMGGLEDTAVNPMTAQDIADRRRQAETFELVQMRGEGYPTISSKMNILGTNLAGLLGYKIEQQRQQQSQAPQAPAAPQEPPQMPGPQVPEEPSMPRQDDQQPFQLTEFFGGLQAHAPGSNLGQRQHRHMEENFAGPEFYRR